MANVIRLVDKASKKKAYKAEWYQRNRERILAKQAKRWREDATWRDERRAYRGEWYRRNEAHLRAKAKARYEANREAVAEWGRQYYEANRERINARNREWWRAHPEPSEKRRERERLWREANPERKRQSVRNRRARKAQALGFASVEQVKARIAYYGGRCWMCGENANSIDHVIPISRGGTNWAANLRPACGSCNSRKNTKLPEELGG